MSTRLALCVLLLCASCPLAAHEMRMMSPSGNSGGACADSSPAVDDDDVGRPASAAARPATHAAKPVKAKPSVRQTGNNLGDIRPPRWHSFLPGMFR